MTDSPVLCSPEVTPWDLTLSVGLVYRAKGEVEECGWGVEVFGGVYGAFAGGGSNSLCQTKEGEVERVRAGFVVCDWTSYDEERVGGGVPLKPKWVGRGGSIAAEDGC